MKKDNKVNNCLIKITGLLFYILIIQNISAYTWQNAVIMGGGFVSGLAYSPLQQNLLYARTDVGGLYRWDNSNRRWIPLTDMSAGSFMGGESIAPDPVNPNVVYAAVGFSGYGNILRSTDQGNSWTVYPVSISIAANNDGRHAGERLAVDPNLPSKLYFGSRWQGLWVSTDSGANWSRVSAFPTNGDSGYGISWVIFPRPAGGYGNPSGSASQTIYVGVMSLSSGNSNVYRSTNGGTSWSVISGGPSSMVTQHASLGTDGVLWIVYNNNYGPNGVSTGQVWKLNTSTLVWTNVTPSNGPPSGSGGYGDVCVDAQNSQHAILSTLDWWGGPDRILRTTNGGTSWTVISLHNAGWNPGPYSVFDLNGANWGYGCGGNPGGAGWAGNAKIDPFNSNNAIYTSGSGPGGGGVWSSTNINASSPPQGVTWVFTDNGLEETVVIYMTAATKGGILFSCLGDICGMRHTNLSQSPASGIYCNPQFSNTNCLDYAENNPNTVVRVGNSGTTTSDIAYSTNNGQTWTPWGRAPSGYTSSNQMGSVAVAADGSAVVVAPYSGYGTPAYATSLGGAWTTCSGLPSGAFVASDRVTASTFYATSPSKWVYGGTVNIYRSTDYGRTFTQVNSIPVQWSDPNGNGEFVIPRPVFGISGEFWVSTYDRLYRFTNGGTSVTTISNVYEPMGPVGFGRAATGQTHPAVYLIGTVNGTYGFYRCDDGVGNTWTRINDSSQQFGGPKWIAGDQDIYGRCYIGGSARGVLYCDSAVTPTNTPVQPTFTRTATATFTRSATASMTHSRTNTVTPTRTNTTVITNTFTGTATRTVTPTGTATRTGTWTRTRTNTPQATNTYTGTATRTNSPSPSVTTSPTRTNTLTITSTASFTRTNTPVITNTFTVTQTRTATPTHTRTATNTSSVSASPTRTISPTHSVSPTITQTWTGTPPSPTNTPTITPSRTITVTWTYTYTLTRIPTSTFTRTITATNTSVTATATNTSVPVTATNTLVPPTATFTRTNTSVPPTATNTSIPATATFTRTNTSVPPTVTNTLIPATATNTSVVPATATNTSVPATATNTSVPPTTTFTSTNTGTWTRTATRTITPTFTVTDTISSNTPTITPTNTATFTITLTQTSTWTGTYTATYTITLTVTPTTTPTVTMTSTGTYTSTLTFTLTATPTFTSTGTMTFTGTWTWTRTLTPTPTFTGTSTNTPLDTATLTPTITPTGQEITDVRPCPNPYNPTKESELRIYFKIAQQDIEKIIIRIYTSGYRLIKEVKREGAQAVQLATQGYVSIESKDLIMLANSTYYFYIKSEKKGESYRSKVNKMIILK